MYGNLVYISSDYSCPLGPHVAKSVATISQAVPADVRTVLQNSNSTNNFLLSLLSSFSSHKRGEERQRIGSLMVAVTVTVTVAMVGRRVLAADVGVWIPWLPQIAS